MILLPEGATICIGAGALNFCFTNHTKQVVYCPWYFYKFVLAAPHQPVTINLTTEIARQISDHQLIFSSGLSAVTDFSYGIFRTTEALVVQTSNIIEGQPAKWQLYIPIQGGDWQLSQISGTISNQPLLYPMSELIWLFLANLSNALIIHASAVYYMGHLLIFSGKSGVGKSTIGNIFAKSGAKLIHDDKILLSWHHSKLYAHNLPQFGSEHPITANGLAHIFFIEHATKNNLVVLNKVNAMAFCMANAIANWGDKKFLNAQLNSMSILFSGMNAYKLGFKKEEGIVNFVMNEIST